MGVGVGFADPVLDSQRAFRAVLDAIAHPGRIVTVAGPDAPPPPLGPASAGVCLTLLDFETPVWLDTVAATAPVRDYLRFHCGAPLVATPVDARFALIADPGGMPPLAAFDAGTDERPDRSATLVVQVRGLVSGTGRRLSGPGIDGQARLDVDGLPLEFWDAARANAARFPRGVDLLLCAGDRLAALPRTTRVEG
jgi:alpha-D-ribose 1-methylphosphonate 5-triphosphate synthase subunit PhnH